MEEIPYLVRGFGYYGYLNESGAIQRGAMLLRFYLQFFGITGDSLPLPIFYLGLKKNHG